MRSKKQPEPAPTFESVWAILKEAAQLQKENKKDFKEISKGFKESKKKSAESSRRLNKIIEESRRDRKELDRSLKEMYAESRRETKEMKQSLKEMYAESRRERAESRRDIKELNKEVGGISNSNGEIAEEYFFNAFKAHKFFANEKYDFVQRPTRITNGNLEAEFDIILFNCKSVAIIEVKYNAKPDNISVRRIISRVETFRSLYPNYKNHNIYLGVAALRFKNGLEERLHRNGIASIRQVGKKMVVYDKEVKVF
jgi:hypothetical protein